MSAHVALPPPRSSSRPPSRPSRTPPGSPSAAAAPRTTRRRWPRPRPAPGRRGTAWSSGAHSTVSTRWSSGLPYSAPPVRTRRLGRTWASPAEWVWPQSTVISHSGCAAIASPQHLADGPAREVGQPVVVGDPAPVPARLAERRHVRQDDQAAEPLQGLGQHGAEVGGGLVAQARGAAQAVLLVQPGQLLDQQVVVEQDLGAGVVAEPAVGPAVVADQAGLVASAPRPRPGSGQRSRGERAHRAAIPARTRAMLPPVEVVVAQHEVDRQPEPGVQGLQVLRDVGGLADVAAEQDGVRPRLPDGAAEPSRRGAA